MCCSRRATPVASFPVAIKDLASRLRALPGVQLAPPDDDLLRSLIVKLSADRQLNVDEALGELPRQSHRALPSRARVRRWRGSTRRRCGNIARVTRALARNCFASLLINLPRISCL